MTRLKTCLAFVTALLASAAIPASADAIKNIVLVHGACVDASGWKAVSDILSKDFKVTMVQEPETSFADDVAAAKAAIADAARSVQK